MVNFRPVSTPHTLKRFEDGHFECISEPRFVSADSGVLSQFYGDGWLAIGDAAMVYDPIASHGIVMSMVSARDATQAIVQYQQRGTSALQDYAAVLWAVFQGYAALRNDFYHHA